MELLVDNRQRFLFTTTAEYPVVSDTHETFGEDVQRKSPDKFHCIQGHDLLFAGIAIVLVMKNDCLVIDVE